MPSVILDNVIVESEEIFRELSRGGIRIFNKDLSRLSPDILTKVWPGGSIAGRWAFIPGNFQAIPATISSGYLKIRLQESNCHLFKGGLRVRFNSDADLAQVLNFGAFVESKSFKVLPNIPGRESRNAVQEGCQACEQNKKKCMRCTISQRNKISSQLSKKQEVDPVMELIEVVKLMVSSFPSLSKEKMLGLVHENKIIGKRCRSQLSYLLSPEEIEQNIPEIICEMKQAAPVNEAVPRHIEEISEVQEQQEIVRVVEEKKVIAQIVQVAKKKKQKKKSSQKRNMNDKAMELDTNVPEQVQDASMSQEAVVLDIVMEEPAAEQFESLEQIIVTEELNSQEIGILDEAVTVSAKKTQKKSRTSQEANINTPEDKTKRPVKKISLKETPYKLERTEVSLNEDDDGDYCSCGNCAICRGDDEEIEEQIFLSLDEDKNTSDKKMEEVPQVTSVQKDVSRNHSSRTEQGGGGGMCILDDGFER